MAVAVYPGTFDPLTRGHEDVMRRAARIFDRAILAVADSRGKNPIFSAQERVEIAREALADCPNIEVIGFSGLLRDFVVSNKANVIVRGLRWVGSATRRGSYARRVLFTCPNFRSKQRRAAALRWMPKQPLVAYMQHLKCLHRRSSRSNERERCCPRDRWRGLHRLASL